MCTLRLLWLRIRKQPRIAVFVFLSDFNHAYLHYASCIVSQRNAKKNVWDFQTHYYFSRVQLTFIFELYFRRINLTIRSPKVVNFHHPRQPLLNSPQTLTPNRKVTLKRIFSTLSLTKCSLRNYGSVFHQFQ